MTVPESIAAVLTALLLLAIAPIAIFVIVQVTTYAILLAKYRFNESHKPRGESEDGTHPQRP